MQLSPLCCLFIPPRSKYPPQHSVLKHTKSTFSPQRQRLRFTPIQNHRQIYAFYILMYLVFRLHARKHKILNLFTNTLKLSSSLTEKDQASCPYKHAKIVLFFLAFIELTLKPSKLWKSVLDKKEMCLIFPTTLLWNFLYSDKIFRFLRWMFNHKSTYSST
jgi:hypothetical protein